MEINEAKNIILNTDDAATAACNFANASDADVDTDGRVWLGTTGWMRDDRLIQFAEWLQR